MTLKYRFYRGLNLIGIWISLHLGWYYLYSRMVRWVVQHKYRNGIPKVTEYPTYTDLVQAAGSWSWVADTWKVGWDSFSYPSEVQSRINARVSAIGDCDDWSLYLAHAMLSLNSRTTIFGDWDIIDIKILTIVSMTSTAVRRGHNVCIMQLMNKYDPKTVIYGHMSNWYRGHIRMATESGAKMQDIKDVVIEVSEVMCGRPCENLGWSICDLDCRFTGISGRVI